MTPSSRGAPKGAAGGPDPAAKPPLRSPPVHPLLPKVLGVEVVAMLFEGAAPAAACLVLVGSFGDGQDHLLLFFRQVALGLLAWIE